MKKILNVCKIAFIIILSFFVTVTLTSCDEDVPDYIKNAKDLENATKLDTPTVTISKSGLASWNAVSNAVGYNVSINGNVSQQLTTSVQLFAGDVIAVSAIGDGTKYLTSGYSEQLTYAGLEALGVPAISVDANGLVSWAKITNATGYVVRVDGFDYQVTDNKYQLEKSAKVEVKAVNSNGDYKDSNYSNSINYVELVSLEAPTITISSGTVTWNSIDGALSYDVYVNDIKINQTETSKTINLGDSIYVIAVSDNQTAKNSNPSVKKSYVEKGTNLTKLATPVVKISASGVASWKRVENAIGYQINVNGNIFEITTLNVKLSEGDQITVMALGDYVSFDDSSSSTSMDYHSPEALPTPIVTIDNTGKASWSAVVGATKYLVSVNGTNSYITDNYVMLNDSDKIIVTAIGDDETNLDSNPSEEVTYSALEKLATPVVTVSSGVACWAPVMDALNYEVKINGTVKTQNNLTATVSYNDTITVRAIADGVNKANSAWSFTHTYIKGSMAEITYPNTAETVLAEGENSWDYIPDDNDMTINWYVDVSSWVMPTGKDEVSKYIKEKTGITVKFETPVADDGQKLTTMIAGNLLPDIISVPTSSSKIIASLAQQGYVYDINTLASKWAPSLYENLPEDVWNWWSYGNGRTYGITNHYYSYEDVPEGNLQPNGGMMVREDIFNEWQKYILAKADNNGDYEYTALYGENAGTKKKVAATGYITTPEGFREAAKWALQNYKGTGAGQITTGLQLSQFTNTGCTSLTWLSQFFAIPFEDADGNYQFQFTTESYKNMLVYLNDLYLDGIITNANFTQDYSGIGGVIAGAQAFATLVTPQDYQMHFVTAKGSGYKYISMYITNAEGDAPVLADIRGYGYLMSMITTSCKRPDIVIKLFDFLTSDEGQLLVTLGIEGVTWNYTDETKTATEFTKTYLDDKKDGTATKYGLMQFDLLINYQYYDNMQPRINNGKTEDEIFRTDLKRPLSIYSYDYNATHFVVDATDSRFSSYLDALSNIEILIGKQVPKIIKASNNAAAIKLYNSTVEYMNNSNLSLVITMQSEAYDATKVKLGIDYGWPPNRTDYDVTPDRNNPNGDLSLYRGTY